MFSHPSGNCMHDLIQFHLDIIDVSQTSYFVKFITEDVANMDPCLAPDVSSLFRELPSVFLPCSTYTVVHMMLQRAVGPYISLLKRAWLSSRRGEICRLADMNCKWEWPCGLQNLGRQSIWPRACVFRIDRAAVDSSSSETGSVHYLVNYFRLSELHERSQLACDQFIP